MVTMLPAVFLRYFSFQSQQRLQSLQYNVNKLLCTFLYFLILIIGWLMDGRIVARAISLCFILNLNCFSYSLRSLLSSALTSH